MNKPETRLPELLAPAGSPEALDAAIEAGADAVYFGAGDFNARMRAKNFSDEEMVSSLEKCAQYGVKTYVTVNTRLRDAELPQAVSLAEKLYLCGASALIVADPGLAAAIKRTVPALELHASTQLSGHSSRDAAAFAKMGFSRMVCPREMSLDEVRELCITSPIEIEMFIHGAHCVSFSGQCLMSFAMGGRSGNRGMCAQPCRLPYTIAGVSNPNPLSLKDMCLAGCIKEITESGVASLKIEGRQKSADYVYGVVSVYRSLLDERRNATPEEIDRLSELFSRDGFTDGYIRSNYRAMLGMRQENAPGAGEGFPGLIKKIPVRAKLTAKVGERASFELSDGKRCAKVYGGVVERRDGGQPMSYDAAREKAGRLGNTAFTLASFEAETDEEASLTLSEINRLRREAVRRISFPEERSADDIVSPEKEQASHAAPSAQIRCAQFRTASQIPDNAYGYFDMIYIPLSEAEHANGENVCVWADPLTFDAGYDEFRKALTSLSGGEVLVNTFGQADEARACGLTPAASFRFNVTNSLCAREVLKHAECVAISPECPSAICRSIGGKTSVTVYGKLPLMHTQRCMMSDGGRTCPFGGLGGRRDFTAEKRSGHNAGKTCDGAYCLGKMTDRTGTDFPIVGLRDCTNIILNSVPIYMADRKDELSRMPADRLHFIFTDETREECAEIIEAYKEGRAPSDPSGIRRIR